MALKDFIPTDKQHLIVEAIERAEKQTSGEIVVHITPHCKGDVIKAATKTFDKKKLYATAQRNAALIYIAYKDRKLAVIGDKGIYEKAPADLWDEDVALLQGNLREGRVVEGIVETVERVGQRLIQYFPPVSDDKNELSNDISFEES